jgi:nicotinamide riboside transporter PnuC
MDSQLLARIIEYAASAMSLYVFYLYGNKDIKAPLFGIINQILWLTFPFITKQWGLLIGAVFFMGIQIRNLIKWKKEMEAQE